MFVQVKPFCVCLRDKAGGYGIQALGGMLVEYVHGDFLNVVGFPLNHFCKQLDLIYNFCTSSLKSTSTLPSCSDNLPTSVPTQPPSSSQALPSHNSSVRRPSSTCDIQRLHTQITPTASPAHKVCFYNSITKICRLLTLFIENLPIGKKRRQWKWKFTDIGQ